MRLDRLTCRISDTIAKILLIASRFVPMLWLKSLHLIFMVTWFAGLFYLPRLFVYHSQVDIRTDRISAERFQIMQRKLFWGIMTPGALLTFIFGAWMMIINWGFYTQQLWMTIKLVLVLVLFAYHVWCGRLIADFKENTNRHNHVWYRWFDEVPTVALVAIILLVVIKPWR